MRTIEESQQIVLDCIYSIYRMAVSSVSEQEFWDYVAQLYEETELAAWRENNIEKAKFVQ